MSSFFVDSPDFRSCRQRPFPGIRRRAAWLLASLLLLPGLAAQPPYRFGGRRGELTPGDLDRGGFEWPVNAAFKDNLFTFARLRFASDRGWGRSWDDDAPEADLNLTFRLHQVTNLAVAPGVHVIDIAPDQLANYPFVYMAASGRLVLRDEEVTGLRKYLLNGGFLMAEDFWGDEQWDHFYNQIRRVFPDREPVLLTLEHRIFHTVFDFKQAPQMPSVGVFLTYGTAWEPRWSYERKNHEPHYYAISDDRGRMLVIICHNNHYGDGWEHEGDDGRYFSSFSEPQAYPMMINILAYAMTH